MHAASRRIDITEPTLAETIKILKGLKSRYEKHHELRYTAGSIKTAAELAEKYINERYLPDKAIDVIDEAGSMVRFAFLVQNAKQLLYRI